MSNHSDIEKQAEIYGDYLSKYPKDKLPKCNRETFEVGGNHPPNGEEYALGCSQCQSEQDV